MHVLFVCTGNICRSPTAERLAVTFAARLGIADFTASSAGVRAVIAHPIHQKSVPVLEELGGNASDFAARQLTQKIASAADLVLTMTRAHRDAVLELAPRQLVRTFTLAEAARLAVEFGAQDIKDLASLRSRIATHEFVDIPDPIGQDAESFSRVGFLIAELLPPVLELCRSSWYPAPS